MNCLARIFGNEQVGDEMNQQTLEIISKFSDLPENDEIREIKRKYIKNEIGSFEFYQLARRYLEREENILKEKKTMSEWFEYGCDMPDLTPEQIEEFLNSAPRLTGRHFFVGAHPAPIETEQ